MAQKKYFYNFNGLRFLAAATVVVAHNIIYQYNSGISKYSNVRFSFAAIMSVRFFFVLSGFLIAYQLLIKKIDSEKSGVAINLKTFYNNRVLRIWPLYYSFILLVYFVFPLLSWLQNGDYKGFYAQTHVVGLLMYLFFLPNLAGISLHRPDSTGHLWSIGVEEFFYIFFPLLVYIIPLKHLWKVMVAIIIAFIPMLYYSTHVLAYQKGISWVIAAYIQRYQVSAFALGILAAWVYIKFHNHPRILLYKKQLSITSIVLLFANAALVYWVAIDDSNSVVYYFLFAIMLLFMALSSVKIGFLNTALFNFLGKISFGIYMFHQVAIDVCKHVMQLFKTGGLAFDLLSNFMVLLIALALSITSYYIIELPFLKLKKQEKTVSL